MKHFIKVAKYVCNIFEAAGIAKCLRFLHLKPYRKVIEKKSATFLKYCQKIFEIADQISEYLHQAKRNCTFKIQHFYLFLSWSILKSILKDVKKSSH